MKRCCIVGTAPSWKETPWNDPSLECWGLNDGYMLGMPRADRWFDLHPIDHMWFRPKSMDVVDAKDVPPGSYIRPEGHLEWLKKQAETIPVYLRDAPPQDWPANARRMPIERIEAEFGSDYWASGPSYMLALAILEGYTEIWITGIHLSTQAEYIEQRPNWEHLLGRVLGKSYTVERKHGFRFYKGDVTIVLPESCPILKHGWKYAYEQKPQPAPNPYRDELAEIRKQKQELINALVLWPADKPKDRALERLRRLEIAEMDCQQQLAKASMSSGVIKAELQLAGA